MDIQTTLFTQVQDYYTNLLDRLQMAEETISLVFLTFDDGVWARRIADALHNKAALGVQVRLMVDEVGLVTDEPRHVLHNHSLLRALQSAGVQVDFFRPSGRGLTQRNRMHCKFCAIDQQTAFMGGSNIGDHYLSWSDTNVRLEGSLGSLFHQVYGYLCQFSSSSRRPVPSIDPSDLRAGDLRLWLTIPGQSPYIRQALMRLVERADRSLFIRTWYFLPDNEMLEALCASAAAGVQVNVLLSNKTRVRPIDAANYLHAHRLAVAGGRIVRYTGQYMHSKLAWNNHGEVLLGSANLDPCSMYGNFEICAWLKNPALAQKLRLAFEADARSGLVQTPGVYPQRSLPDRMLSHACNLASAWL